MKGWQEYTKKRTEELVSIFQEKKQGREPEEFAFYALVDRFGKDLLQKCEINCKRFGHDANVAEIICEATFRSYAKKGNFNLNKGEGRTADESFKLYLYVIARNELTNYYRLEQKKAKGQYYDGSEKIVCELPQIDLKTLDTKSKVIYEIIQSLSPSHRTVYLTYKSHEKVGCNLPKELRNALRAHLGNVSQSTIRSYKKEATDKITEGLKIMELTLKAR
jgi:DNA-directed RNA polymerase specialized sigma24 family protein